MGLGFTLGLGLRVYYGFSVWGLGLTMGLGFTIGLGFRTSGILSAANTKGSQIKGPYPGCL